MKPQLIPSNSIYPWDNPIDGTPVHPINPPLIPWCVQAASPSAGQPLRRLRRRWLWRLACRQLPPLRRWRSHLRRHCHRHRRLLALALNRTWEKNIGKHVEHRVELLETLDFSPNSVSTPFSGKFPHKVALVKSWHAFRLHRLTQSLRRGFRARHFSCKFPHKVALLKCWHAFRLRTLAQSVCPRSGLILVCSILPVNFWVKLLFWNLHMHFDCAGSQSLVLGSGLRHFTFKFPYEVALLKSLSAFWAHSGLRHVACRFPVALLTCWHAVMQFDWTGSHKVWS